MLELLYATGLRVSELINLTQSQVNFNQGVLRIVGKGDRERLIPLGEESQHWLKEFINGPRMEILLERQGHGARGQRPVVRDLVSLQHGAV